MMHEGLYHYQNCQKRSQSKRHKISWRRYTQNWPGSTCFVTFILVKNRYWKRGTCHNLGIPYTWELSISWSFRQKYISFTYCVGYVSHYWEQCILNFFPSILKKSHEKLWVFFWGIICKSCQGNGEGYTKTFFLCHSLKLMVSVSQACRNDVPYLMHGLAKLALTLFVSDRNIYFCSAISTNMDTMLKSWEHGT